MIWYIYFFKAVQYIYIQLCIYKRITIEMSTYILPMKSKHHIKAALHDTTASLQRGDADVI